MISEKLKKILVSVNRDEISNVINHIEEDLGLVDEWIYDRNYKYGMSLLQFIIIYGSPSMIERLIQKQIIDKYSADYLDMSNLIIYLVIRGEKTKVQLIKKHFDINFFAAAYKHTKNIYYTELPVHHNYILGANKHFDTCISYKNKFTCINPNYSRYLLPVILFYYIPKYKEKALDALEVFFEFFGGYNFKYILINNIAYSWLYPVIRSMQMNVCDIKIWERCLDILTKNYVCDILIRQYNNVYDDSAIHQACKYGYIKIVYMLLLSGASIQIFLENRYKLSLFYKYMYINIPANYQYLLMQMICKLKNK